MPEGRTSDTSFVQRSGAARAVARNGWFRSVTPETLEGLTPPIVLDGVFVREPDGTLRFHPASLPTDEDVRRVVARVRRRLERLGLSGTTSRDEEADPLAEESPALAGLSRAAILGRAVLGPRAGRGPERIGADPDAPWIDREGPLHAHDAGFDLHAAVHVEAGDRERLERLCQYLCRPPIGQGRLKELRDGRIAVVLQRP
jgi:Putative transposase